MSFWSFSIILTTVGLDWVNIIYEDYLYITIRYIILQFVALVLMFLFIRTSRDTEKYCMILVLASYGGNLINLVHIRRYIKPKIKFDINFMHYIMPMTILFVNSLATMVYVNSDITMLGFFCSDSIVGIYGFSSKIYNILKQAINSIVVVTVPRLAYFRGQNERIYQYYIEKLFSCLIMFIFPVAVGFAVFGDSVIHIVGGVKYLPGTASFRILMFALIFALMASVFSNCILIINRCEKYCLISTFISATANVILNFFLIPKWGMTGAAITTVIAELVNLAIQSYFVKRILKISVTVSKKNIMTVVGGCILVFTICVFLNHFMMVSTVQMTFVKVVAGYALSILAYGVLLLVTRNELLVEMVKRAI